MSHSEIHFWRLVNLLTNEQASKKRIFEHFIDELFWALDDDLCIFMTKYVYVFCFFWCTQFKAMHFDIIKWIFSSLWQEKDIFVDFVKMKRDRMWFFSSQTHENTLNLEEGFGFGCWYIKKYLFYDLQTIFIVILDPNLTLECNGVI